MGFFSRKPVPPKAVSNVVVGPTLGDMITVKGVGNHQSILAGRPRAVSVELMPWANAGEILITAKIDGKRVGDVSDRRVHPLLLAMRKLGMQPVFVRGEIRKGDYVPRYLAIELPDPAELKRLLPEGWAPERSEARIYGAKDYLDAIAAAYLPKSPFQEADLQFRVKEGGKFDGQLEAEVTLGGRKIGEMPAARTEYWQQIHDDHAAGQLGKLMVKVERYGGASNYRYDLVAEYRRAASTD